VKKASSNIEEFLEFLEEALEKIKKFKTLDDIDLDSGVRTNLESLEHACKYLIHNLKPLVDRKKKVSFREYKEALLKAWKEYWKEVPPWYAPLEKLHLLINKHLPVDLTLKEHLHYIKELAKWGKLDYLYGGLDPRYKHWVELKTEKFR